MSSPLWTSPLLPNRLRADLPLPPERRWRRAMSPELSYGRHSGPARSDVRAAAVAIMLTWSGHQWTLPLTVRHASLTRHGGQVSLPGGLIDQGETSFDAALREVHEELGLLPAVDRLGELSPMFVFASNTFVTPCVAVVRGQPVWTPNPAEVDQVLELRVGDLLQQQATSIVMQRGPLRFAAPYFPVEGHVAWGATAAILAELRGRLERCDAGRGLAPPGNGRNFP